MPLSLFLVAIFNTPSHQERIIFVFQQSVCLWLQCLSSWILLDNLKPKLFFLIPQLKLPNLASFLIPQRVELYVFSWWLIALFFPSTSEDLISLCSSFEHQFTSLFFLKLVGCISVMLLPQSFVRLSLSLRKVFFLVRVRIFLNNPC